MTGSSPGDVGKDNSSALMTFFSGFRG